MELLGEAREGIVIVRVPFRRNLPLKAIQDALGHLFFQALDPRREGFHPDDTAVYTIAGVESSQRSVREIPFTYVEAKALVDHAGPVPPFWLSR